MRFIGMIALALTVSAGAASASSDYETFVTAKDWSHSMSQREKYLSLIPPSLLFAEYDVDLKLSLPQYVGLIDQVVRRNPQLENEEVSNIFASTIFLFEPDNRAALRRMELAFLKGEEDGEIRPAPKLSIEDLLERP